MKRKTIFQGLSAFLLIAVVTVNLAFSGSMKHLFHPRIARASFDFPCMCSMFGGNTQCLAHNFGINCAPTGVGSCEAYNQNCAG